MPRARVRISGPGPVENWKEFNHMTDLNTHDLPTKAAGRKHEPVVYYATAECGGAIKIGTTVNLALRMRNLSRGKVPLHVVAAEPGNERLERAHHVRFKAAHIGGDYFWWTEEIEDHINSLPDSSEFLTWAFAHKEGTR